MRRGNSAGITDPGYSLRFSRNAATAALNILGGPRLVPYSVKWMFAPSSNALRDTPVVPAERKTDVAG
ncbi:MAG TPA: hypothetical protein VM940_06525 [Chthoniobacterales bacterium]|jgi:hypothetical protein|nr:hypothetical protein [Chthoniobacterales bacterium]